MNKYRNPYLAMVLVFFVLLNSCSETDDNLLVINQEEINKFNYTTFETFKGPEYKVLIPDKIQLADESIEKYEKISQLINDKLGSDIFINELDENYLRSGIHSGNVRFFTSIYLNQTDRKLLTALEKDLANLNFDDAINQCENNVTTLSLSEIEFKKYNAYANILKVLKVQEPNRFDSYNNPDSRIMRFEMLHSCGDAVLSYTLATLGLAACGAATGPAAPLFCAIAIANKIRTFKIMIESCREDKVE